MKNYVLARTTVMVVALIKTKNKAFCEDRIKTQKHVLIIRTVIMATVL